MSYEFAYDPNSAHPFSDDEVTVPEYWNPRPERIFQVAPYEPFFMGTGSIVQDNESGRIGIDCGDKFRDALEDYISEDDAGGMLVEIPPSEGSATPIEGIIVDLRYSKSLLKRDLGFCLLPTDHRTTEALEYDAALKTREALALIFFDEPTGELHLRVKRQIREQIAPYAVSLMEYVDTVRHERRHDTIHDMPEESDDEVPSRQDDSRIGD